MTKRILLSSPDVTELEEEYVLNAMRSGWIAPIGPDVDLFEREVAERVGTRHAVALSSGTAALHLALLCKGIGPGSIVVTSTMTFAATLNAIIYTGAQPYLVDCDIESGNMDPLLLKDALARLAAEGSPANAIMTVDLLGKAVNYTELCRIAADYGIPIIADAAESLGASHAGLPVGQWGDVAAFSFNGNKVMTTSGGGMLVTNDGEVAEKTRYLATQARQPVLHYEHNDVGYNYRLSNLLAALGRAQLRRLDSMIGRRKEMRDLYRALFQDQAGVRIFGGATDSEDNAWLTSLVVDPKVSSWSTGDLAAHLDEYNIESRPLWKPMHLQKVFSGCPSTINGSAERLFEEGITLPSGSALSDMERAVVVDAIGAFLK